MFFLLQKENSEFDIEVFLLKNILDKKRALHEYTVISLNDLILNKNGNRPKNFNNAIPVGTLEFVGRWLDIYKGIKTQNPIEIPPVLRTDEFLKRRYSIVTKEYMPSSGKYFIKDASELKRFSYNGDLAQFLYDGIWDVPKNDFDTALHLDSTHLYQVSESVHILSEHRVYIINSEIQAVAQYDGDPCIFPDMNLIKKANLIYSTQPDYPKSYTIDIMITDKGTSIIEIHNFVSVGIYTTLFGDNLIYAYRDGIDYILNHNTKQTKYISAQ